MRRTALRWVPTAPEAQIQEAPWGVSDARRFGAAERAVRRVGRAGTAAPSGWNVGPELTLI
eukprot:12416094-Alexandrium_andersonii.AAC.1